jgi:hypothetical protein
MTPTELWLPIGAAAFYLYDSAVLLWQNELIFTRGKGWRSDGWLVDGGSALRVGARRVFLPHPLLPQRPQFQVHWVTDDQRGANTDNLATLFAALRPIGMINQLQVALLLALPLISWTLGAGIVLLALFALFYVLTMVALVLTWQRRKSLQLAPRAFWMLALDALACAPFAVNHTRKIAMRHGIAGDPLAFAAQHFDAATHAAAQQIVAERLQEERAQEN